MSKVTGNVAHPSWLRQRECGQNISVGHSDRFFKSLYSAYYPYHSWNQGGHIRSAIHGGILNVEFSPDGSFFVAACEKHSLLLFDPLSRKMIRCVNNAHTNSVTSVKFVDSRHFATGSIDSTVALWDARNLRTHIRLLEGHSHAVQDVEYSPKDGLLVTSGFDGSIRTWDINSCEEDLCRKVFHTSDLLRMRLTANADKMVVSTANGYLLVVHGLDLIALAQDLSGFQPDASRLHLRRAGPPAASFVLFSRRARNRVELVMDFPREDDSNALASLALHPAGSAALTRGCSETLGLEWTCVHDVQGQGLPGPAPAPDHAPCDDDDDDEAERELEAQCIAAAAAGGARTPPAEPPLEEEEELEQEEEEEEEEEEGDTEGESEVDSFGNASMELWVHSDEGSGRGGGPGSWDASGSSSDDALVPVPGRVFQLGTASALEGEGGPAGAAMSGDERVRSLQALPGHAQGEGPGSPVRFAAPPDRPRGSRIFQYTPRLTHFIEERSAGKWYMRELSFSPDGRLMSAPFGCGVRMLAFSPECSELSVCVPRTEPLPLHELAINICHNCVVLCSKFSPRHCLLVSGCFSGDIVWHQPLI